MNYFTSNFFNINFNIGCINNIIINVISYYIVINNTILNHYLIEYTNPFIAGGIAGVNSWLFTYPIDTLKSRKQLYQNKTLKEMIKMGSLYNGLTITLIRAFVVNSSSFYMYDLIKKLHLQD